jgi:hypothetical protein
MAVLLGRNVDRSHYDFQHRITVVKTPTHPSSIRLLAYWQECQARGGMRMGVDVPSRAIAPLLQDITVAEPVDDWADARMRLAGSAMMVHFGRDVRGLLMSEIFAGAQSDMRLMLDGARSAIARNRPGTVEHIISDDGREVLRQEMTMVPIRAPVGDAGWSLTGTFNF